VLWELYTLKYNTLIMERMKYGILRVSISVVLFQKCVHIKSCLARGYISRALREIKVTFIPAPMVNYSHTKAYCPISQLSLMQKTIQI